MAIVPISAHRVTFNVASSIGTNDPAQAPTVDVSVTNPETGEITFTFNNTRGADGATGTVTAAADGTAAAPGIAFAANVGTGLFRIDDDTIGIATNGNEIARMGNGLCGINYAAPAYALHVAGDIHADAGSFLGESIHQETQPNYAFRGDEDTGMYRAGANTLGFAAGGVQQMRVAMNGIVLEGAAGGFNGAGSLTAASLHDDDAVLSCYVFKQFLEGKIDLAEWDDRVPDRHFEAVIERTKDPATGEEKEKVVREAYTEKRRHDPARLFAKRIGTKYDPLTLDGYALHWKDKGHLTAFPNEENYDPNKPLSLGGWVQRYMETHETHACLIELLNLRTKQQAAEIDELRAAVNELQAVVSELRN